MHNKINNLINSYVINGIIKITNFQHKDLNIIIKNLDLPYYTLNKYYNYLVFKTELFRKKELLDIFNRKNINISPYLQGDNIYYFFGIIGLCYIFGIEKVKNEIPFYDDMVNDINNLPDIIDDSIKNLYSFIEFNNKHIDYNSNIKNTLFVFTHAFKNDIINFKDYLK